MQPSPKSAEPTFTLPSDYKYYENKEAGFRFAYPKLYQDLFGSASDDTSQTLMSAKPNPPYVEGSSEAISVTIASPEATFSTLKYGPSVKFVNGELIVQDINPADGLNVVGKPFKGFVQPQDVVKQVGDLKVSVFSGGDEGTTYHKYAFLTKDKLIVISLPGFYDGVSMMCPDSNCKANDMAKYDAFGVTVLNSITKF